MFINRVFDIFREIKYMKKSKDKRKKIFTKLKNKTNVISVKLAILRWILN